MDVNRLTPVARGGAFLALILGLVLFAHGLAEFLGDTYLPVVAVHIAVGLLAVVAGYVVLAPSMRRTPGARASRVRTAALVAALVLAVLALSGALMLAGALTAGGNSGPGRLVHLVSGFAAIAALVWVGLAARRASTAS